MIRLSICIPTIDGREASYDALRSHIDSQISAIGCGDQVEVLTSKDNREMSIGVKRNQLYSRCNGLFAVQIDDDDWIADDYIEQVLIATHADVDCIGYLEQVDENGRLTLAEHSIKYTQWRSSYARHRNIVHERTPFCKTPIKTHLCKLVAIADLRFGEDHDFAMKLRPMLRNECFINKVMYYYKMPKFANKESFNQRYGANT